MAKQIMCTHKTPEDRKRILAYWKDRNKYDTYSNKLNKLCKRAVNLNNLITDWQTFQR